MLLLLVGGLVGGFLELESNGIVSFLKFQEGYGVENCLRKHPLFPDLQKCPPAS